MLLRRVHDFIGRHQLLDSSSLYLAGLSGGADSVALLLVLRQLGYRVEAAHCNFKLRGSESDRDENFVRELCNRLGVELHVIHFDTKEYASLHKVSIEMAARDLRYGYFSQLCEDIGAAGVCIAHHRDDAVETLLLNLLRGAGIHGLTGIRPKNAAVLRPLICASRKEITDYLDSIGQSYVTDSSNLVDDVVRNKIRLRVLPLLEGIAPGAAVNIDKTAGFLREAEKVYLSEIQRELAFVSDGQLSIDRLMQFPSPSAFLHEWLSPLGFNSAQTAQVLNAIGSSGRKFYSATHVLLVDRASLVVEPVGKPMKSIKIPECGLYRYDEATAFKLEVISELSVSKLPLVATLDASLVQFPLVVRAVEPGDRFVPFGMKGSKLVSDYLTDRHLNVLQKYRQMVVVDASGRIIWLVGQRTDDRFRVSDSTLSVLRISIQ